MNNVSFSIFLVVLAAALIWRIAYRPPSLRDHFKSWVEANHLTVLASRRRYIFTGPFFFDRSGIVFKISVRFEDGSPRTGWTKFGYNFSSKQPWSSKVFWDTHGPALPNPSSNQTLASDASAQEPRNP